MDQPEKSLLGARMDRRQLGRLAIAGASSAALVSLLAACGGDDDDDETPASGGSQSGGDTTPSGTETESSGSGGESKVIIAQGVDVRTFDPHEDTRSPEIFRNLFDNLLHRNQDLELVPSLAETWENIDETTWEFTLRQDVTFHDGTPLTSKDVKYTFDRVLNPDVSSRIYTFISMIDRAEVVDDYTVRIITKNPFPALPTVARYVFVLPADKYEELGPEGFSLAPVGTGPYKFVEWVPDGHFIFERYDDHWRGQPSVATVEVRPVPEDATRVSSLKAGEIDIATLIPVTDVAGVEEDDNLDVRAVRSLFTIFVGMNTWNEPFTDARVRQAMNYAVDVEAIIENLLEGHGYPLGQICAPPVFGYNPDIENYPYDPDRARELLAEAGYPDGFNTTLDTPQGQYLQDVEISQAIAGQLAEVGVNVEVRPAEFNEYFDRWLAKSIEGLYFLGNTASTLDVDAVLGSHFDSERRGLYYNSPESDEMIHAAAQEFDVAKREEMYHELMQFLHDQAPWIFLYNQENIYGVNKTLEWTPVADERLWVFDMKRL